MFGKGLPQRLWAVQLLVWSLSTISDSYLLVSAYVPHHCRFPRYAPCMPAALTLQHNGHKTNVDMGTNRLDIWPFESHRDVEPTPSLLAITLSPDAVVSRLPQFSSEPNPRASYLRRDYRSPLVLRALASMPIHI
ncbi:hypothetical protein BJV74DRAFT_276708 [Russula compacta]|nr:hypothetical protein BJV74DRAFT_276708 [Russula compacta]